MGNGSLKNAIFLDFTTFGLDHELEKPIPPYGTISGWFLFDSRIKCDTNAGTRIQYRISFDTFSGKHVDITTPLQYINSDNLQPGNSTANMTGPQFRPTGAKADLSNAHVRFYGDEIP